MKHVFFASLVSLQDAATGGAGAGGEHQALDPWELILEASPIVKAVMILLLLMFLVSSFITGAKLVRLMQATGKSRRFLDLFWQGEGPDWTTERLEELYAQVRAYDASPVAQVFRAGYVELARVMGSSTPTDQGDIDNIERALRRSATTELTAMEAMLPFLATTGSTAPFIGLFGTVIGIIIAFKELGANPKGGLEVIHEDKRILFSDNSEQAFFYIVKVPTKIIKNTSRYRKTFWRFFFYIVKGPTKKKEQREGFFLEAFLPLV